MYTRQGGPERATYRPDGHGCRGRSPCRPAMNGDEDHRLSSHRRDHGGATTSARSSYSDAGGHGGPPPYAVRRGAASLPSRRPQRGRPRDCPDTMCFDDRNIACNATITLAASIAHTVWVATGSILAQRFANACAATAPPQSMRRQQR